MKKTLKYVLVLMSFLLIQSCVNTKVVDVKSPCVSGDGGPCGPKIPVNTWLLEYDS
jgi:hypothetical protein